MKQIRGSIIACITVVVTAMALVCGKPLTANASGTDPFTFPGGAPYASAFSFNGEKAFSFAAGAPYSTSFAALNARQFNVPLPSSSLFANGFPSSFAGGFTLPSSSYTSALAALNARQFNIPLLSSSLFANGFPSSFAGGFTLPSSSSFADRFTIPSAASFASSYPSFITTPSVTPAPTPASGGTMRGIDVSAYQGVIDWNKVRQSGISFAIIRCGFRAYGSGQLSYDSYFDQNVRGAQAAGIKVGAYFYSAAVNVAEAREEANFALSKIRGYSMQLPVFIDMESPADGRAIGISVQTRTDVVKAFCSTVQAAGYKAGVYANKTWFNSYMNTPELTQYTIWLAHWVNASRSDYSRTRHDIWQYTSSGSVPGISGRVDMNISYVAY